MHLYHCQYCRKLSFFEKLPRGIAPFCLGCSAINSGRVDLDSIRAQGPITELQWGDTITIDLDTYQRTGVMNFMIMREKKEK